MLHSTHLLSGFEPATATFALTVFFGGAALAVFAILIVYLISRAGMTGMVGVLGGAGLVLVGAVLAAGLLDRQLVRDHAAERRAIELRSAELLGRAIAPGSALACLDNMITAAIETACERSLFATPEAVAAAVDYTDAKLSLLAAGAKVAEGDKTYQPSYDRLRRSLESDRYGLVAHALAARGCSPTECADFALLHDTDKVVANMKAKLFEAQVGVHALAWQSNGAGGIAQATASALPSTAMTGISPMPPSPATSGVGPGKFDYPSAASIPPVSIMNAEPAAPPPAEAKAAAPVPTPKRAPAHRQAAKKPAAPPKPPLNTVPQETPPAATEPPQTSGSR